MIIIINKCIDSTVYYYYYYFSIMFLNYFNDHHM